MQNNIAELTHKLQRSLDNNYNVLDLPAVVEIVTALEKASVTKEILETTRLGRYINGLRRRTTDESLAKRAKDLVKKWRNDVLPTENGRASGAVDSENSRSPDLHNSQAKSLKRAARDRLSDVHPVAKMKLNGQMKELFDSTSDNSSNCFEKKSDVIMINSDSNSSMPEHFVEQSAKREKTPSPAATVATAVADPVEIVPPQPKKRGRKKGSKNHRNLIVEAEASFSNKMAVSRNSKVKTTQELLADLQNRANKMEDIKEKTAKLTESLTKIDQQLNPQRFQSLKKDVKPVVVEVKKEEPKRIDESEIVVIHSDDEHVDVVGTEEPTERKAEPKPAEQRVLTLEEILAQLPPVDRNCLDEVDPFPVCTCPAPNAGEEGDAEQSVFDSPGRVERTSDGESGVDCCAKTFLETKYNLHCTDDDKVNKLHTECMPNVNSNYGLKTQDVTLPLLDNGLYANIVPNFSCERLPKKPPDAVASEERAANSAASENYKKYSISIDDGGGGEVKTDCDKAAPAREFREWHETLDVHSYNDEILRILPYVIID